MKQETKELLKTGTEEEFSKINKEIIIEMLGFNKEESELLFEAARRIRNKNFSKPTIRAVIEISNYCRGSCHYCAIRKENENLKRYRMSVEEIVANARDIYKEGIRILMLQSGEDLGIMPTLLAAVKQIREKMPEFKIIICCGERKLEEFQALKEAGADMYLIKLETTNDWLFKEYKAYTTFESREEAMNNVKKAGLALSTGFIVGMPKQTDEMVADDIIYFSKIQPKGVSGCPFMPNKNSPLENEPACSLDYALKVHAILRLLLPNATVPSCSPYEILEHNGQLKGFNAGANNITINATPLEYRKNYPLYSKHRVYITMEHTREIIKMAQPNWQN